MTAAALRVYIGANINAANAANGALTGKDGVAMLSLLDLIDGQRDIQTPTYASSIAITTTDRNTVVKPAALTGALSLTAVVISAVAGDLLSFLFLADSTARVVTFSTNFSSTGTLRVGASANATIDFVFNGTSWIEQSRNDYRGTNTVTTAAYATPLAVTPGNSRITYVNVGQLTGIMTINATLTNCVINDRVIFTFSADGTGRVVTFGTNMKSSGTLTVAANKWGTAEFIYDGTNLVQVAATATA
jgi:hypothetical protein